MSSSSSSLSSSPEQLGGGAFPACFMVVTGVLAYNSFLRQARSYEGGSIEDFFPALALTLVTAAIAGWGYSLQTAKASTSASSAAPSNTAS